MQRFKKISIGLLIALLMVGSALAIVLQTRTLTHNIQIGGGDFQFYSDAGCTIVVTTVEWGSLMRGNEVSKTLYLKNIGSVTIYIDYTVAGLPSGCTLTMYFDSVPWGLVDKKMVAVGTIKQVGFYVNVGAGAVIGSTSFTTVFNGNDVA